MASSPIEILNYKDEEAGHGQVMSGVPGEAVMGEFHWKVCCYFLLLAWLNDDYILATYKQEVCSTDAPGTACPRSDKSSSPHWIIFLPGWTGSIKDYFREDRQ